MKFPKNISDKSIIEIKKYNDMIINIDIQEIANDSYMNTSNIIQTITGENNNDCKSITNPSGCIEYVTKYVTKPESRDDLVDALHKKLVSVEFYDEDNDKSEISKMCSLLNALETKDISIHQSVWFLLKYNFM